VAPYTQQPVEAGSFVATRTRMEEMLAHLSGPVMMSSTQEALEDYVTATGRELLRQMMQDQLDARAQAEVRRASVTGADQVVRRRAEAGHRRLLATTVGRVEVNRIAYRALGAANLHPADTVLALPGQLSSYPLQKAVVHEVASGPLRSASAALERTTGVAIGTRQLMETVVRAAADVRAFYQPQPQPQPQALFGRINGGGALLVLSIDATGVNMIPRDLREGTRTPAVQVRSRPRHNSPRASAPGGAAWPASPPCTTPCPPRGAQPTSCRRTRPNASRADRVRARRAAGWTPRWSTPPRRWSPRCSTRPKPVIPATGAAGSCWSTATTTSWSASSNKRASAVSPSTSSWTSFTSLSTSLRHEALCYIPRTAGRDWRIYLWA
jgi:hypothetical protein